MTYLVKYLSAMAARREHLNCGSGNDVDIAFRPRRRLIDVSLGNVDV